MRRFRLSGMTLVLAIALAAAPTAAQDKFTLGMAGATWMLALHAALVKGFFAEEGLRVEGLMVDTRAAVEQGKPHMLWVRRDGALTEADFGFIDIDQLHHVAAGIVDYYVVDGMNFGCMEVMVPPDSPLKSPADLKGKRVALNPWWFAPFRSPNGLTFVNEELKANGLDPARDATLEPIPWEALPRLNTYVAEGFKAGTFDAVGVTEPQPMMLRQQQVARPLFTQTYQAPYNQEHCCLFGIKRSIVDQQPDRAALILRAFRRAKQWTARNPAKAVVAAQTAGYYPAELPVQASASRVVVFGFDREVDLASALERAFADRIKAGAIQTDKTPQELIRLHYRKID